MIRPKNDSIYSSNYSTFLCINLNQAEVFKTIIPLLNANQEVYWIRIFSIL